MKTTTPRVLISLTGLFVLASACGRAIDTTSFDDAKLDAGAPGDASATITEDARITADGGAILESDGAAADADAGSCPHFTETFTAPWSATTNGWIGANTVPPYLETLTSVAVFQSSTVPVPSATPFLFRIYERADCDFRLSFHFAVRLQPDGGPGVVDLTIARFDLDGKNVTIVRENDGKLRGSYDVTGFALGEAKDGVMTTLGFQVSNDGKLRAKLNDHPEVVVPIPTGAKVGTFSLGIIEATKFTGNFNFYVDLDDVQLNEP